MPSGGAGTTGDLMKPNQWGWYKRRLPVITDVPWANAGATGGGAIPPPVVAGASPGLTPAYLYRASYGSRLRTVLPPVGLIRPRVFRPIVVRSDARRAAVVLYERPRLKPATATVAGGVLAPRVVRRDYGRGAQLIWVRPPFKPVVNVAGGVLPPWVKRSDYRRAAIVYRMQPFLKTPPPPVPGGVTGVQLRRWDFERAALYYRTGKVYRLVLAPYPPPVFFDGTTWHAEYRDNEWDSDQRTLTWSADVAEFLTKRSGETRHYTMDFSALPELQSAALASLVSVSAQALTVGANNISLGTSALGSDGKSATVWISGGDPGASYKVTFTVTVAGGTTLEDFGYLLVEDE